MLRSETNHLWWRLTKNNGTDNGWIARTSPAGLYYYYDPGVFSLRQEFITVNTSTDNIQQNVGYAEQNSSKVTQNICLISCTNIVRVDSPNHPRLLLALTKNRAAGSTTKGKKFRMRPVRFENNSQVTYAFEKWYHRDVQV